MKKQSILLISMALMMAAGHVSAGDAAAGKSKSSGCVSCHGINGISMNDMNPNLAGQKKGYLAKAIKDYRDGKRDHVMMKSMVQGLSDADIDNIATYYSELKP